MMSKNHKGIYLQLHLKNDADVIKRLLSVDNMQGYIKSLIRNDIQEGEKKDDKSR